MGKERSVFLQDGKAESQEHFRQNRTHPSNIIRGELYARMWPELRPLFYKVQRRGSFPSLNQLRNARRISMRLFQ